MVIFLQVFNFCKLSLYSTEKYFLFVTRNKLLKFNVLFESEMYEIAVMYTIEAAAERKPGKKSGLNKTCLNT